MTLGHEALYPLAVRASGIIKHQPSHKLLHYIDIFQWTLFSFCILPEVELHQKYSTGSKREITEATRNFMTKYLESEYEFYNYAKQVFYNKLEYINKFANVSTDLGIVVEWIYAWTLTMKQSKWLEVNGAVNV